MSKARGRVGVDTNVLVYAVNESSVFNSGTRKLLKKLIREKTQIIITWQNLTEFYAIVTDKKRFPRPMSPLETAKYIGSCLDGGEYGLVLPNVQTGSGFLRMIKRVKPVGQRIYDVFLAATLVSKGVERLITGNKKDFAGIAGLEAVGMDEFKV